MAQILGYIYKITNKINEKSYIGQTTMKSVADRVKCHEKANMVIGKAIRKYGIENFKVEELATCYSIDELNKLEIKFIEFYQTIKLGYNCRPGGKNYKLNPENIKVLQKAHKNQAKPVVQYDKNLNKIREFYSVSEAERVTGVHHTAISSCCKKQKNYKTAGGFVWSYRNEKPANPICAGKTVIQLTKDKKKVKEFISATEAAKQTSIYRSNISECCLGIRKSAGGFIWKFKEVV